MSDSFQLDMFGDISDNSNEPIPVKGGNDGNIRERADDLNRVGAGVPRPLEEVSPDILPESSEIGNTAGNNQEGGKQSERRDLRSGGERPASPRSAGDSAAPLHSSSSGGKPAAGTDYRLSVSDNIGAGGKVAKFDANIATIRLLKELEEENRRATAAEQSVLVKYTGWGGLSEVFNPNTEQEQNSWTSRNHLLKEYLSPKEYRQAAASTLNAHYTSPDIIAEVWSAVRRMGYTGGPTLEPAVGTGLFFGGRPEELPIKMYGIELDSISGRIAKQLYPSADIQISGYENYKIPENRFNLVISNVPFGNYSLYESRDTKTPGVDNGQLIHNFYFLKSLHGVKESGLVAFITSKGTLDSESTDVRKKIAQTADFLGAIRLPNNAFKQIADTEVVADIVFLQKRPPDVPMSDLTKLFISTSPISLTNPQGDIEEVEINNYFLEYPDMVMGTQDLKSSQYGGNEYTVNLDDRDSLPYLLSEAIEQLPESIMRIKSIDKNTDGMDSALAVTFTDRDHFALPIGSFAVGSDLKIYQKESQDFDGGIFKLHPAYDSDGKLNDNDTVERIRGMIKIRDCTRLVFYNHYNKPDLQGIATTKDAENLLISDLNYYYDKFTSKYGVLNSPKNYKAFMEDPDSSLLVALEYKDKETGKYYKSDIFTGVNFAVNEIPDRVDSILDAMSLSLTQYGSLDIGYMASLTNMERGDLITELITSNHAYLDHESFRRGAEAYIPADEYLSGNIRRKIRAVESLIETAPQFARNLSDLKAVMPRDLGPQEIRLKINSPIVGQKHVQDFVSQTWKANNVESQYIPNTGEWKIDIKYSSFSQTKEIDTTVFGYTGNVKGDVNDAVGIKIEGLDILDKVMNGKPVKVEVKNEKTDFSGGKISVIDRRATDMATAIAQDKAEAIANAFSKWVWTDTDRTNDIVHRYNEIFNSTVPRKFTHPQRMKNPDAQIYLHGCAFHSPLRPHQADAIWRIVQQKNTMLAHAVGAGKTLEMACAAMEMRRLGLRNKPMIVCPNHMIKQWAKEVREAYPAAKLLIADDKNWNAENRKAFINRIATGDWDAVIIRSTSFKYIAMSPEKQLELLEQKKAVFEEYLDSISKENRWTRKNIEKKIAIYDAKIKKLADTPRDDNAIHFERLGVDHLFIDEADMFKNLEYSTQLSKVKGLGTPVGSERAFDMFMKIQHIQSNGGGITFATGTPISNTLVEAYTMQRYLQPEELELNGLIAFDSWVRQFAEAVTTMELNNTGTDFKSSTRLSKIVNVPELMTSLRHGIYKLRMTWRKWVFWFRAKTCLIKRLPMLSRPALPCSSLI